MSFQPDIIKKLAEQFAALPGIGRKSAWRLAFHILNMNLNRVREFSETLLSARENVQRCSVCQNLTDKKICSVCSDAERNHKIICVVETPKDILVLEKSRCFDGVYHVIHGLISPMDGIGPNQLAIKELLNRVTNMDLDEIILATSPTIEGEATAMYISKLLKNFDIKLSRLAYGMPIGSELQYADEMTISKAIENRNPI